MIPIQRTPKTEQPLKLARRRVVGGLRVPVQWSRVQVCVMPVRYRLAAVPWTAGVAPDEQAAADPPGGSCESETP